MKIKQNISIILVMVTLLLFSCDPGVDYRKIVQNNSKYDIMVIVDTTRTSVRMIYTFDSILVAKHSVVVIATEQGMGITDEFSSCGMYNDSLYTKIVNFDNLHLNLDLNENSNWVFDVLNETFGGGGECECRIKITDSMIIQ